MKHHVYYFDQTILTTLTVGKLIDIANELALHIAPTKKKHLSVIKKLKILNQDHKHAMDNIANRKKRRND